MRLQISTTLSSINFNNFIFNPIKQLNIIVILELKSKWKILTNYLKSSSSFFLKL